ncbi:MAG: hypothetical protein LBT08_08880 [Synergistaceae bacterium]|jgi:hypothetical protein|nr:hypothetical protein [Synergistaceae bacterium]
MRVRLDDVELSLDDGVIDGGHEAIYEEARKKARASRRVIIDIIVDGESVGEEDAFFSLSGGLDIRFVTQPIRDLVSESMDEGKRYFVSLKQGLDSIATLFEESNVHDAQAKFAQAIDGINWLLGVFDKSCLLLGVTSGSLRSGDYEKDLGDLNQALTELASSMESGKTMSQAYLIREKLAPSIERFSVYWDEVAALLGAPLQ